MNVIYKLIYNVSNGTWAVASELTASRGRKSRFCLAAGIAATFFLPAASMADDSPHALQCEVGQVLLSDGMTCSDAVGAMRMAGGIGTAAIGDGAININQLTPVISALGGGASIDRSSGAVTGPTYTVGGSRHTNVGSALTNLDGRVSALANMPSLVTYDNANQKLLVGEAISGNSVDFRSTVQGARTLEGVRAGTIGAISTQAVNGSQLFTTNQDVASNANDIDGLVTRVTHNETEIGAIDTRVGATETNISNIQGDVTGLDTRVTLNETDIGAIDTRVGTAESSITDIQNDATYLDSRVTHNETTLGAIDTRVGATETNITNIQGDVTDVGTRVTHNETTIGAIDTRVGTAESNITTIQTDVSHLDTRINHNTTNITSLNDAVSQLSAGAGGVVVYDAVTQSVDVATGKGGTLVSFAGTEGARTLAGVADGALDATSNEAINGSQLFATNQNVAANTSDIAGLGTRITDNTTNITSLNDALGQLSAGAGGVVVYDAVSQSVDVATGRGGTLVSFAGTEGARTLAGVADGTLDATSNEAINGSQLFATNQNVAANTSDIAGLGTRMTHNETDVGAVDTRVGAAESSITTIQADVSHLDTRVTHNTTNITSLTDAVDQLSAGTAGVVVYDAATQSVDVASGSGGTRVNFAGADGARILTGVADATLDASSRQAVNGSQLFATNENVARNTANIVTITDQLDGLAGATVGLVTYDDAAGVLSVAANKAGNTVSFAGSGGARTLAGVAEGTVAADSEEAVNGSQLHATNARVANTETNITNLDGRVTSSEGNIANLSTQVTNLSNGSVGLVQMDAVTGEVKIAAAKGGDAVDVEGADGQRRLTGVANGIDDSDTVTMAQLRAAGALDPVSGDVLSVLTYDDSSLSRASLGGTNGTVLANLADGLIGAGSREAVNGGQLHDLKQSLEGRIGNLDGRVGAVEQRIDDGSIGGGGGGGAGGDPGAGGGSVAIGDGSNADGAGAVAIGDRSSASGDGAIAIGEGASASGKDSIAVGKGSSADGDNEFSVGSEGNERVVSRVAAGTRPTDAVNLQQMDDRFQAERSYTDGRFTAMDKRIDRMGAMSSAMLNMATSAAGVQTVNRVAVGVGFQGGQSAMSVGYQRALSDRATLTISGAFSGDDKSAGFGAGFGW